MEGKTGRRDRHHGQQVQPRGTYALRGEVLSFLHHLGYRRAVMMSDGEHAVVALKEPVAREAGLEMVSQETCIGS